MQTLASWWNLLQMFVGSRLLQLKLKINVLQSYAFVKITIFIIFVLEIKENELRFQSLYRVAYYTILKIFYPDFNFEFVIVFEIKLHIKLYANLWDEVCSFSFDLSHWMRKIDGKLLHFNERDKIKITYALGIPFL